MRIPLISLVAAGALALGGCAYGGLGLGMGYGDPYYGGGYGYGSPYGYGSYYGNSYYGGLSYGYSPYGYSPYGWYNNYYYPGSGYYVYDNNRRARVMTDSERRYWMARIRASRSTDSTRTVSADSTTRTVRNRENWSGFRNRTSARTSSTSVSNDTTTTQTSSRRRNRSRD